MSDKKSLDKGWICPVCEKVLAPRVNMCKKCSKTESKEDDGKTLLQE